MKLIQGILLVSALILSVQLQAGVPRQSWAHLDGVMKLQPNGVKVESENVLNRLLIQEAFSRWGIAHDEGQLDVVRSLFTRDAELIVLLGSKEPIDSAKGVDNIAKTVANSLAQQQDQRRHAMINIVIDKLTENRASAIAYGIVTKASDGLTLGASVIYYGDLVKEDDGVWRFSRFIIGIDHYAGQRIDPVLGDEN